MKLSINRLFTALVLGSFGATANPQCSLITPETLDDVAVKVSYKGKVPAINKGAGSYNMMVAENFDDFLIFIDQKEGILYKYTTTTSSSMSMSSDDDSGVEKIYDVNDVSLPEILQLDIAYPPYPAALLDKKIHNVAPGPTDDSILVVFTSATGPSDNKVLGLPTDFEYNLGPCTGEVSLCFDPDFFDFCCYGQTVYKLFYKFDFNKNKNNGALTNPELFFALEMQNTFGHDGGAMLTIPDDGRVLYSVGDCLPYGLNGLYASQDADSHCGKMLLIDPTTGSYEIVASGIRNSQQMNLEGDHIVFMDIGGVTAEEVNAVPLADLLDTSHIENFGWGMVRGETKNGEDFGREGTFIVGRGEMLQFQNPPCLGVQTGAEANGFIPPYMQFGRGPGFLAFGISSSVVSDMSFDRIKAAASELNTGNLIVALEDVDNPGTNYEPAQSYIVKLYNDDLELLEDSFNSLVEEALGPLPEDDSLRGDARLFKFPDGTAGVFIERTGQFFELSEIHGTSAATGSRTRRHQRQSSSE